MVAEAAATGAVEALDWAELAARDASEAALPKADPDATAYLQSSSGSTRFPHRAAVSHRGLLHSLAAHSHGLQELHPDRFLSCPSASSDRGLFGCLLTPTPTQGR